MATDFGSDLSCKDDLDPTMTEVTGLNLVREAAYRRLVTRRGRLIDDLDYGLDVRDFLSSEVTPTALGQIPGQVDAELTKDERVASSTTAAAWDPVRRALTLTITAQTAAGPFSLVLPVSQATSVLLGGG